MFDLGGAAAPLAGGAVAARYRRAGQLVRFVQFIEQSFSDALQRRKLARICVGALRSFPVNAATQPFQ